MLLPVQQMNFRQDFKNPYRHVPIKVTDEMREKESVKPVWERAFDHQKYMKHTGPLKMSTGISFLDVEPFPRMKLMKLYYLALQEIDKLPNDYGYKLLSREMTRYRMKVVDETMEIREIEKKIGHGLAEELIFAAHNEIKLLRVIQKWQPWKYFATEKQNAQEELHNMANFRHDNPFPAAFEDYEHMRHDAKPRGKY